MTINITSDNTAPWFEDFKLGDDFSQVPAITITDGYAAIHQAIFGDRLRLPLDHHLSKAVTGDVVVNPSLVCNVAIGQSTFPSQRVMGNLFYRGLILQRPVYIGDTLSTQTRVVALRQNKSKPGRSASGMVALEMHVTNQNAETVMLFWRCPMIPCRDKNAETGQKDSFDFMPETLDETLLLGAVPNWNFGEFKSRVPGFHFDSLKKNQHFKVEARDTITLAPELVRLTLNMARTHTDANKSVYRKRLVYGGHTISLAAAQISRELPNMLTVLGWLTCDHLAPVFEEDILRSEIIVEDTQTFEEGGIAMLHVESFVSRDSDAEMKVLDWRLAVLFA